MAKKLLCVLLSVLMVVAMLPTGVFADTSNFNYIYVAGVNILEAENYTVTCGDGTAVYDPDTDTITLTNATITASTTTTATTYYGIYAYTTSAKAPENGLTIKLVGDNTIVAADNTRNQRAIYVSNTSLSITSESGGTLTTSGYFQYGLLGKGVNISDCTISLSTTRTSLAYGVFSNSNGDSSVTISNSTITIVGGSLGIYGGSSSSSSSTIYISDSIVDISGCSSYCIQTAKAFSDDVMPVTIVDSVVTCTTTGTSGSVYLTALTVGGDSTVIADGGIRFLTSSQLVLDSDSSTIYAGSSADDATVYGAYTEVTTLDSVYSDLTYTVYSYLKIVTGTGDGGPISASTASSNGTRGVIYLNEDYHAFILSRNGHRYFATIPHDVDASGYCTVCKEYIGTEETETSTATIDGVEYEEVYSCDVNLAASGWGTYEFDDNSIIDALATEGAILVVTRSEETSIVYGDDTYEKLGLVDSWWVGDWLRLGTAGHTDADEADDTIIDCMSDDGTTIIYDGATVYAAWVAAGMDNGGTATLITNTSGTYTITNVAVFVPAGTVTSVDVDEPAEEGDIDDEEDEDDMNVDDGGEDETSAETNPTTGAVLALVPMALAGFAVVSSKRR